MVKGLNNFAVHERDGPLMLALREVSIIQVVLIVIPDELIAQFIINMAMEEDYVIAWIRIDSNGCEIDFIDPVGRDWSSIGAQKFVFDICSSVVIL